MRHSGFRSVASSQIGHKMQVRAFASRVQRHLPCRRAVLMKSAISPIPDTATHSKELQSAMHAVKLASKLCQTVQKQLGDAEKTDKQDDSPVTVADYGAQAVVAWALQRSGAGGTGKLSMVAEEDSVSLRQPEGRAMLERITQLVNDVVHSVEPHTTLTPEDVIDLIDLGDSAGGSTGRHWVLDPIDGTRGFVSMRQYAVCLGMLQDGKVEIGVLGCPNLPLRTVTDDDCVQGAVESSWEDPNIGSLFCALRGHGAYMAPLWTEHAALQRISVNDIQDSSQARFMESFESRHSNHSYTASVAKELGINTPPLRMDSQVKYGLLSRGDASIFMRFPVPTYREKIWDHCAGFCIVEEAGGVVSDGLGKRLDFSEGRYLSLQKERYGIIAAPPTLHKVVVDAVKRSDSSL